MPTALARTIRPGTRARVRHGLFDAQAQTPINTSEARARTSASIESAAAQDVCAQRFERGAAGMDHATRPTSVIRLARGPNSAGGVRCQSPRETRQVPLRSFVAPDGARWQVWGVAPPGAAVSALQRRVRDRRSPEPVFLYKGAERRRQERRKSPTPRPVMQTGWLVFESARAKRRLAPPPEEWDTCAEPQLVELWNRATPVPVGARVEL